MTNDNQFEEKDFAVLGSAFNWYSDAYSNAKRLINLADYLCIDDKNLRIKRGNKYVKGIHHGAHYGVIEDTYKELCAECNGDWYTMVEKCREDDELAQIIYWYVSHRLITILGFGMQQLQNQNKDNNEIGLPF